MKKIDTNNQIQTISDDQQNKKFFKNIMKSKF